MFSALYRARRVTDAQKKGYWREGGGWRGGELNLNDSESDGQRREQGNRAEGSASGRSGRAEVVRWVGPASFARLQAR